MKEPGTWYIQHSLSVVSFFLTLMFAAFILRGRRSAGSTLSWLAIIVLAPYLGIPLYLFLSGRKIKNWAKDKQSLYVPLDYSQTPSDMGQIRRLLMSAGVPSSKEESSIKILTDGVEIFENIIQWLDSANQRIHISTFILGRDEVGRIILEKLIAKAKAGVQVRLLIDGFGSFWGNRRLLRELQRAGGRCARFMPLLHVPFRGHSNLRNHRKLIIIDDKWAMLGGMNLAIEEMGPAEDSHRWIDLTVKIQGQIVKDVENIFLSDWKFATGEDIVPLPAVLAIEEIPNGQTAHAQVVASGPDVSQDTLYDSLISSIYMAQKRVWILTPYFIPDESITRSLELAARRGVDVRILVPARSNHILADFSRASYMRQIEEAGGRIFLYPKMIHAKANVIDNTYAAIGSANLDMRSLFLNYEVSLFLYSKASIDQMILWFEKLMEKSGQGYPPANIGKQMLEGVGRILGPML